MSKSSGKSKVAGQGRAANAVIVTCFHCGGKSFSIHTFIADLGFVVGESVPRVDLTKIGSRRTIFSCDACGEPTIAEVSLISFGYPCPR